MVMLRPKISSKIVFAILGKPAALQNKQSSLQKKISRAMMYQDTRLVR